ncbi:MAG: hypothetical protein AAFN74_04795 [Myxococcota bacterium]
MRPGPAYALRKDVAQALGVATHALPASIKRAFAEIEAGHTDAYRWACRTVEDAHRLVAMSSNAAFRPDVRLVSIETYELGIAASLVPAHLEATCAFVGRVLFAHPLLGRGCSAGSLRSETGLAGRGIKQWRAHACFGREGLWLAEVLSEAS